MIAVQTIEEKTDLASQHQVLFEASVVLYENRLQKI
jgi:hypothetical protein